MFPVLVSIYPSSIVPPTGGTGSDERKRDYDFTPRLFLTCYILNSIMLCQLLLGLTVKAQQYILHDAPITFSWARCVVIKFVLSLG